MHIFEDYEISLDHDMLYVYWREINMPFIRELMGKICYALADEDDAWDLWDNEYDHEIDKTCDVYVPDDDSEYNESLRGADVTEEEAEQWLNEWEEEYDNDEKQRNEYEEKQQALNKLYTEKYNSVVKIGYSHLQSEFIANLHKSLAMIDDEKRAVMKIVIVRSMYVYIEQHVKIMSDGKNDMNEERKKTIIRMLTTMFDKIGQLKAQAVEHLSKGIIGDSAMKDLFAVLDKGGDQIEATIDIINGK